MRACRVERFSDGLAAVTNPRGYYARRMAELRAQRGNHCERCGASERKAKLRHKNGLEFAHVITTGLNGRGRGRADRVHDIKRNPAHYLLLCRDCHLEYDRTHGPRLPEEVPF